MRKQLMLMLIMFSLVTLFSISVSGEMTLWSNVIIDDNTDSVSQHSYYQYYDDIEALTTLDSALLDLKRSLLSGRTNDVYLWAIIEKMPYNTTNYTINYCEYNITHTQTDYDSNGNLIQINESTYGFVYSSLPSANTTYLFFRLKNRDSLVSDIRCYYNDSNYLYDENILFGRGGIYLPANKCGDCEEYTLEELSNEIDRTDEIIEQETSIYNIIQSVIDFNFTLWLIAYWLAIILFVMAGVTLIFGAMYYVYRLIKDIEENI